jgi:protein-disulfide isomerase
LAGCHPSQSEVDALQAQLDVVTAQQAEILARMDAGGDAGGSSADTHGHAELIEEIAAVGDGLQMVHRRLDDLESRIDTPAVAARPSPSVQPGRPDPSARYRVELLGAEVQGSDDALITVVAWVDYQCPFSARVQATLQDVRKKYGAKVRIVAKHNPLAFHTRAKAAALAAEAAGRQGKFWKMHDKLFENQRALEDKDLRKYARKLQLDLEQFDRDLKDPDLARKIDSQQTQGNELGARGTPAFFINGRFLSGAQPLDAFERLIDEELVVAQALVRRGVDKARVYDQLMAEAKDKP